MSFTRTLKSPAQQINHAPLLRFSRYLLPLPLAISAVVCQAQEQASDEELMEEVVTIGTRYAKGRTVTELPVAVDVMSAEDMRNTGQTEVGRMLQTTTPSFNFSSSSISDGTDALRPATLRGLGPDQTLVLINGKRRHNSALMHVNTSVGRGTAGVDMNAIPASAIKRIEVLRDGATAQYGSDAIAGVINVVLKDDDDYGVASASYGETKESDGETEVFSINKGFEVAGTGFLNLTYEYRDRGRTSRAGDEGSQIYLSQDDGSFDPREFTFDRGIFRIGDADSTQNTFIANLGVPVNDGQIYSFLTYSRRENTSGGFLRRPTDELRNPIIPETDIQQYPDGFLPLINTDIDDYSLALGYEFEVDGWNTDISVQRGRNIFKFNISNSLNASHVEAFGFSPTSADAGELHTELTTYNVDTQNQFGELTLSFGAEYKEDKYEIKAGDPLSYEDFDPVGTAEAGIQVFPGFQPQNEVDEDRDAKALYADAEYNISDTWMVGAALRYEDYSDFGDTTNGKLSTRIELTDWIALRASASTGFRAPSMQQLFFNNVSTQFDSEGNPQEVRTFPNADPVVKALGIPELTEEESDGYAIGFILTPMDNLSITFDYYSIEIEDRIVISGKLNKNDFPGTIIDTALGTDVEEAQFFLNAADTETEGFDLIVTYDMQMGDALLKLSSAINVTETDIESLVPPSSLATVPDIGEALFPEQDQSIIEEWQPEDRINLTANYSHNGFSAVVSFNRYGEYSVTDGERQTFDAKWLADLQFNFDLGDGLHLKFGGNNIFDETPEKNTVGQSRSSPDGGLVDPVTGRVAADSAGVFKFSRRSAPFGFNGAYYYGGISYEF